MQQEGERFQLVFFGFSLRRPKLKTDRLYLVQFNFINFNQFFGNFLYLSRTLSTSTFLACPKAG